MTTTRSSCLVLALLAAASPARGQDVASVSLSHKTVQLRVGQRVGVYATANDARGVVLVGQRFEWTTSDAKVVRVEVDRDQPDLAYLVGVSEGLAQVQVRAGSRTDAVAVQVSPRAEAPPPPQPAGPPATVFRIDPSSLQLLPVETGALTPIFLRDDGSPAAASAVTWTSHNPAVASVTAEGRIVAQADGRAVIEARAATGLVATASIEVASAVIGFAPPIMALSPGREAPAQVVVPAQGNRPLTSAAFSWRSSDETIARVSAVGVVQAVGAGRAAVTAEGLGQRAVLNVTVHRPVVRMRWSPADDRPVVVPLNGAVAFSAEALDANGQQVVEAPLLWKVVDTATAAFDSATRRLQGKRLGRTRLQLTGPAPGLEIAWDVQVIAGGVRLGPQRAGLSTGDTLSLTASWTDESGRTIGPASDLTWTTSNTNVVSLAGDGTVVAAKVGRASVIAAAEWGRADTATIFVQGAVLFTSTRGGSPDIFALDPRGATTVTRLTSDTTVETMAAYAPDGAHLVFLSNRGGTFDLYLADADGANPRRLTNTPGVETTPHFTPDGAAVVYAAPGPGGAAQVWIAGTDGSAPRALTQGAATNAEPAVSADGRTIAFTSTRDGNYDVYLMTIDGADQRNVSRSVQKESHPAWLPDGQLAYIQERGEGSRITPRVVRHDLGAGRLTVLTPETLAVTDFAVSPDGATVVLEVSSLAGGREDRHLVLFTPATGATSDVPRASATELQSSPSFRPRTPR